MKLPLTADIFTENCSPRCQLYDQESTRIGSATEPEYAKLILKAVNNHDALVKALAELHSESGAAYDGARVGGGAKLFLALEQAQQALNSLTP